MNSPAGWAERIRAGERRAIARAITAIENDTAAAAALHAALAGHLGQAHVIGITGPPGAGKSTLVNALVKELLARGERVAVVAVDPSSPYTGGAVLGDRIRMGEMQSDERVFIRSLASRGHLGGLSRTAAQVVEVLDAAGYESVIVETVGAGQSEVEVASVAATRIVVCPPGLGDEVQTLKAGVLEIADVLVVNKADLPDAARTERELGAMLALRRGADKPLVLKTTATTGEGIGALVDAIARRRGRKAAALPEAKIEFRSVRKTARLHDPRRDFALTEIESEVRYDPLTGESARICHFAYPKRELPDLSALAEATSTGCPFCPHTVERVTPRYPEELIPGGRLRRGAAVLAPNLFPYDDFSAIVALCAEHFVPMDGFSPGMIANGLKLAREFIALASPALGERDAFGIVTWNYMPPSGASQVHPHFQVMVTDTPGNALKRELHAEATYLAQKRRAYAQVLIDAERHGERWLGEDRDVAWWVPYCPSGMLGDAQAVFSQRATLTACSDAELEGFAEFLSRLLGAYARLGLWSFNLTFLPDAERAGPGSHRLSARLLPRFYLHPHLHNSDVAYLQLLLGEKFGMVYPERHAAELREQLKLS
jgi:LAO/AO transport system ATPase